MQFTYHTDAKNQFIQIDNETYNYLFKARRHKINDEIYFRNLVDKNLYLYKVISIDRRKASCELIEISEKIVENAKKLHIVWCIVDPKTVEKNIASLNEIGVDKITFVPCDYSQKNFKINFEKLEKILLNSSSQCGRSSIIKLEKQESLEKFLLNNPDSFILDFSETSIESKKDEIQTIVIGCEGGFSNNERDSFNSSKVVGFNSNLILRSETATISVASKILI
ncbi:MAG: 16S rRNA (uracil(1498)-N(3))-methyltransferase [Halarcobacter sp.]